MARVSFLTAIWTLAISLGILGYQILTWYFYQGWPDVSLGFGLQEVRTGWQELFGGFWLLPPHFRWQIPPGDLADGLNWLARRPIVPVGVIFSYALFLLSDALRGRAARHE